MTDQDNVPLDLVEPSSAEGILRILAQPVLEKLLRNVFTNHKQLRAYELSDGQRSTREIAGLVGAGQKTISRWWVDWESNKGIIEQVGIRGQYKKKYALIDLATMMSSDDWFFDDETNSGEGN